MSQFRYFKNREDAAKQLAAKLKPYAASHTMVLAIPRGGVPLGSVISKTLALPLDLLVSKKIPYPDNEEFAMGAVCQDQVLINEKLGVDETYTRLTTEKLKIQNKERYFKLTGKSSFPSVSGWNIILVDDGVATGFTMKAAVRFLRNAGAGKIILATPVIPGETLSHIKGLVDDVVCILVAHEFPGVGAFYQEFPQVSDAEVADMIN